MICLCSIDIFIFYSKRGVRCTQNTDIIICELLMRRNVIVA